MYTVFDMAMIRGRLCRSTGRVTMEGDSVGYFPLEIQSPPVGRTSRDSRLGSMLVLRR
jgi:hypothetical protein